MHKRLIILLSFFCAIIISKGVYSFETWEYKSFKLENNENSDKTLVHFIYIVFENDIDDSEKEFFIEKSIHTNSTELFIHKNFSLFHRDYVPFYIGIKSSFLLLDLPPPKSFSLNT